MKRILSADFGIEAILNIKTKLLESILELHLKLEILEQFRCEMNFTREIGRREKLLTKRTERKGNTSR